MSDGIKSGISQLSTDVKEAAIEPVVDEVGKAIEQGVQSVINPQASDPAVAEKKKQEEEKRRQQVLRTIDWYKTVEDAQAKVRQEQQQKLQGQKQEEHQEKQVKQFKVLEEKKKKQEMTQVQKEARRTEIKGGVGG